jgi:hypothetical protein
MKKSMHNRLGMGPTEKHVRPSTRPLTGTLAGLLDKKQGADAYVKEFSKELRDFTLSEARAQVQVWACVLSPRPNL